MKELLPFSGKWYKGNLHMHTMCSDGLLPPAQAVELYHAAGYDFLALTDHWVQSAGGTYGGMLTLSGCEYDTGNMADSPVFHIVGIGMDSPVSLEYSHSLPPQGIVDAIRAAGGIAILAHPAWSVTDPENCMNLQGISGAEIYNSISGLPWNGERADSSIYFDIWATRGKYVRCMAADDSHFYNGEQTRSFTMVHADALTRDSVMDALRRGSFYASQGPLFRSLGLDGSLVRVECSPVETIVFSSNTVWCGDRVSTGGRTQAEYLIKPTDRYVRVTLIDKEGKKAWSSPFPVNSGKGG